MSDLQRQLEEISRQTQAYIKKTLESNPNFPAVLEAEGEVDKATGRRAEEGHSFQIIHNAAIWRGPFCLSGFRLVEKSRIISVIQTGICPDGPPRYRIVWELTTYQRRRSWMVPVEGLDSRNAYAST